MSQRVSMRSRGGREPESERETECEKAREKDRDWERKRDRVCMRMRAKGTSRIPWGSRFTSSKSASHTVAWGGPCFENHQLNRGKSCSRSWDGRGGGQLSHVFFQIQLHPVLGLRISLARSLAVPLFLRLPIRVSNQAIRTTFQVWRYYYVTRWHVLPGKCQFEGGKGGGTCFKF